MRVKTKVNPLKLNETRFLADVHKKELHKIHFDAWKKGLKSLYYCRSKSIQRAENINDAKSTDILANVYKNKSTKTEETEYEECLSCQ